MRKYRSPRLVINLSDAYPAEILSRRQTEPGRELSLFLSTCALPTLATSAEAVILVLSKYWDDPR
jgi:hypothetical protein